MRIRSLSISCFSIFFCALLLAPAAVEAQSQNSPAPSVVDAARRDRERKKDAKTPAKVITTDDLMPASSAGSSAQNTPSGATGTPSQTTQAAAQTNEESSSHAPSEGKAAKDQQAAKLADLKSQLATAKSDLDFLQRQLALQQDTYYSNPDYVHDTAGKAQLDQMKQQIANKEQAVEELKTRLAALQELAGKSSSTEKPNSSPQS